MLTTFTNLVSPPILGAKDCGNRPHINGLAIIGGLRWTGLKFKNPPSEGPRIRSLT